MGVTWFATIFNVHAEQAGTRLPTSRRAGPVTHTGEGDLVRVRRTWQRPCAAITTYTVQHGTLTILASIWIEVGVQAGTIKCIKEASVEVAFAAALCVPDMCPATMDARIAQEVVRQVRVDGAHFVSDWRAYLAAVRDVANIAGAHRRVILAAAAGYPAGIWNHAEEVQVRVATGLNDNVRPFDVPDAVGPFSSRTGNDPDIVIKGQVGATGESSVIGADDDWTNRPANREDVRHNQVNGARQVIVLAEVSDPDVLQVSLTCVGQGNCPGDVGDHFVRQCDCVLERTTVHRHSLHARYARRANMSNGEVRCGYCCTSPSSNTIRNHNVGCCHVPILDQVGREDGVRGQDTHCDVVQAELGVSYCYVQGKVTTIRDNNLIAERWILRIASDSIGFFLETAGSRGTGENHSTLVGGADYASDTLGYADARNSEADYACCASTARDDLDALRIMITHMPGCL